MSLNYKLNGNHDTTGWTEYDRSMYDALIWATLGTDIGELNIASAEEFCKRANWLELFCAGGKVRNITPNEIVKFFGLTTNVSTLTHAQWASKHVHNAGAEWKRAVSKEHGRLCKIGANAKAEVAK